MPVKPLKAVILAAGKGTRLREEGVDLPKVLRSADGKPLLSYLLNSLSFVPEKDTVLVVGYMAEQVLHAFPGYSHAHQCPQLGTGHAVACALDTLKGFDGDVLVCNGDLPLIRQKTFENLIHEHREKNADCTLLTGTSSLPLGYGRIVRAADGRFSEIVEERDCDKEQLGITELNIGVYLFRTAPLRRALAALKPDNAQGEYYLTDCPHWLIHNGCSVCACKGAREEELLGVNTPADLARVEAVLRRNTESN